MHHPVDAPLGAPADPSAGSAPDAELTGKLLGSTRRSFIRDVAVAGTSTAAALYGLDEAGVVDLVNVVRGLFSPARATLTMSGMHNVETLLSRALHTTLTNDVDPDIRGERRIRPLAPRVERR